jgi:hypothetical protein
MEIPPGVEFLEQARENRSGRCDALDVLGFQTFVTRRDLEGNIIAFIQGFKSLANDAGVMHKNILAGILGNKPKTFFVIEPFYFSTRHICS